MLWWDQSAVWGREERLTCGTVNCMLLWPLHTHTSPNNTSLREMVPKSEVAVITNGVTASVGGRVTFHRHMALAPEERQIHESSNTYSTGTRTHARTTDNRPGVRVASILVELKETSTALQPLT